MPQVQSGDLGDVSQQPLQTLWLEMSTSLELEEKPISIYLLRNADINKTEWHNWSHGICKEGAL